MKKKQRDLSDLPLFGDFYVNASAPAETKANVAKSPEPPVETAEEEEFRRIYSVEELTKRLKKLIEGEFVDGVWVSGEVSGLRIQSSGHYYFTLKDAQAQISCVLFKGVAAKKRDAIADGRKLTLKGELSLYAPRGQYQLVVREVEEEGLGKLALEFERLKRCLKEEGLFDDSRKLPIPPYPLTIGVATSASGAALQDVLRVLRSAPWGDGTTPMVNILLAPCRVQGESAGQDIARAIKQLHAYHQRAKNAGKEGLDLILVTRGGGSAEDLACFNDEAVARAIDFCHSTNDPAVYPLPVISAVGHEIDFTISDFTSDLRCATPTAAAQRIIANLLIADDEVQSAQMLMNACINRTFDRALERLDAEKNRLNLLCPRRRVEDGYRMLDDISDDLRSAAERVIERLRIQLPPMQSALQERMRGAFLNAQNRLSLAKQRLDLLDFKATLQRGFTLTVDAETRTIIRSAENTGKLGSGTRIKTVFHDGSVDSVISEE